jgi:hypothetical protein
VRAKVKILKGESRDCWPGESSSSSALLKYICFAAREYYRTHWCDCCKEDEIKGESQ